MLLVLNEAFGVGRSMYPKACYPDKKNTKTSLINREKERNRRLEQGGGFLLGDFGDCQMKGVKIVYFLIVLFGKIWCTD